jgi:hypothetical protein
MLADWHFTSRQPMSSGATCSAGRQKKVMGRAGRAWWLWEWLWEWLDEKVMRDADWKAVAGL